MDVRPFFSSSRKTYWSKDQPLALFPAALLIFLAASARARIIAPSSFFNTYRLAVG